MLKILEANSRLTENKINELLAVRDNDFGVLFDSMSYSANGGGKRIRPTLTLEFFRMLSPNGSDEDGVLALAAAIELIHTYSLIHDDLPCMDNDDFRRGKPSNHKEFGEATALLAGDALLTLAFEAVTSSVTLSDKAKVNAVSLLAKSAGANGMIGGQQLDLLGEERTRNAENFDFSLHRKMNLLKTGALISAAAQLGCIAAGADENAFTAARTYAENVGLAFQVTDDLLDMGEEDEKTTYLSFMTAKEAAEYAASLTENAVNAVSGFGKSENLVALARFIRDRKV